MAQPSNSTPKSRARSRSKTLTNMASKLFWKFVYRKCCMDRLRFRNICLLNRRPYLSQLDFKEKCTRYARVSTNEADLFDRHDHRTGQSKIVYYHTYLKFLARLTLEKEAIANRWKIATKWLSLRLFVAMATVCHMLVCIR